VLIARLYRTAFIFHRYSDCVGEFVQAAEWAGGKIIKVVPALKSVAFCVPELPGQSKITKGTAATFGAGVSLLKVVGINLSAQTGHSTSAALAFQVNGNPIAHLGGTTDFPGGTKPGLIQQTP